MPEHLRKYIESLTTTEGVELLRWLAEHPHETALAVSRRLESKERLKEMKENLIGYERERLDGERQEEEWI